MKRPAALRAPAPSSLLYPLWPLLRIEMQFNAMQIYIAMRLTSGPADRMPYPIFHGSAVCYFHRPLMGALRFLRNSRRREGGNPPCAGCDEISFSVAIFPGIIHKPYFAFRKYMYLYFFFFFPLRKDRANLTNRIKRERKF